METLQTNLNPKPERPEKHGIKNKDMTTMVNKKKGSQEDSITIGTTMTKGTTNKKESLAAYPRDKNSKNQSEGPIDSHAIMAEKNKSHVKERGPRDSPDKTMDPDRPKISKNCRYWT